MNFISAWWARLTNATWRSPGVQSAGSRPVQTAKPVNADTALALSAVWACTRLTAEGVGAMPIDFSTVAADGTLTEDKSYPLAELFRRGPNRYQTRNEFMETMVINLMLHGNAYARKVKNARGEIISLMPLMAEQMEVSLTNSGERTYLYTEGVNVVAMAQENVWHVPLMPSNGVIGLSPLQYGARTMGIAMAAEDRVNTLAANGFKPAGVLMIDKVLKPEQRQQIREQFSDLQEGQGDPLKVLEAGMTYQQVSMSPRDVQLIETRRFSIEDIARFYGVPSILINDAQATTAWGTGIGEIKEGFYTLTLQPLLERIEASMKKWLVDPEDRDRIDIEFDFSRFLRGNQKARVEAGAAAVKGGLKTINEVRREEGLPPVDGGDQIYVQAQMRPLKFIEGLNNEQATAPQGGSVPRA